MVGKTLSHYEILEPLGAGGMGEVYRARDTNLDRNVAIKVLPKDFAADADRLARFEREAKLLASLNHANIAAIYGLEDEGDQRFIAMELVEGEALAERIVRSGRIEVGEALEIALQIAEALEAAHENGVIHRDLKPANVMVTSDGKAKVLDFGLAKASTAGETPEESLPDLSHSPTMIGGTQTGVILGTAAYMSPEQARGRAVDQRADIWAFGCVVYEMLAGRPTFDGSDAAELLVSVMSKEPEWGGLPPGTPEAVRRLLKRCLQKDPKHRLKHIGDAVYDIEEGRTELAAGPRAASEAEPGWRAAVPWGIATAATVVAAALGAVAFLGRGISDEPSWHQIIPPNSTAGIAPEPALSPDGESIVFTAQNDSGDTTLWQRRFDSPVPRELPRTEGATLPFWSPDSQSVAFFDMERAKLKRIDFLDEEIQELADVPNPRGGSWSRSGEILYGPNGFGPLYVVSDSAGGEPRQVTTLGDDELAHLYPHFLPDGNHFLYVAAGRTNERHNLYLGSLDSSDTLSLDGIHSRAEFVDGQLLFGEGDTLYAQRFDVEGARLVGGRVRLADGLGLSFGTLATYAFSSGQEALIFAGGGHVPDTQLVFIDQAGRRLGLPGIAGEIFGFVTSPDGTHAAVESRDPVENRTNILLADLAGTTTRLVEGSPAAGTPLWEPGGDRVISTDFSHSYRITNVRDTEDVETFPHANDNGGGWLEDWFDQYLVVSEIDVTTLHDIWIHDLSTGDAKPYLDSTSIEWAAEVSPTGRWLAYVSDVSNEFEVYVQSFPERGNMRRISRAGAGRPRWGANDEELYYVRSDGMLMVAILAEDASGLTVVEREPLFVVPRLRRAPVRPQYAVLDEGRRFVFNEILESVPRVITVIRNWKSLVPER